MSLAKYNLEHGLVRLKRWWTQKYNLPPNHNLFTNQSVSELTLEMYEDAVGRRDELLEKLNSEDTLTREASSLLEQLNALNKVLGYAEQVQDELIDKWERELAEGKVPNLNEV